MVGLPVSLVFLLPFFIAASQATAGPIPNPISTASQTEFSSVSSSSTLPPTAFSSHVPVTHGVAQQQPQTGHNYALDPFGFLGSTEDDGNATSDTQQAKQTQTSKTAEATSASTSKMNSASIAVHSTSTSHTGDGSTTGSSAVAMTGTSSTEGSYSQSVSSMSVTSTDSPAPSATPSQANDPSSGSSMNSWKIIGIGVLAFVGVVVLVLGTAFQDTILRALGRPFRRRGRDGEELLVPDWRRGSWRIGQDEAGMEKFDLREEGGPRIGEGEKGGLAFPLPPVSPFPLRRTPTVNTHLPAEMRLNGVGGGNAGAATVQDIGYSILPSPPPAVHTPQPPRSNKSATTNPFVSPHERLDSDAYGGIE